MNRKENEAVQRRRVREGTEESAKPLFLSCMRKQQMAQRARHCQICCQMHQMFFTTVWSRSPLPSFSIRSSLSHLICSNLSTLPVWVRNQVTNRKPLCFIKRCSVDALILGFLMLLIYFRTLAFRITQGHYNSSLFALWNRLMWCALPCLPKRKCHFYLLKIWEDVFL